MGDFEGLPETRRRGLEKMEQGWLRLIGEARRYAPDLVEAHFNAAQAVHLRYLARRSLRLRGDPAQGVDFLIRAWRSDTPRLLQEPRRTGLTALAVLGRLLLHRARRCAVARPRPERIEHGTVDPNAGFLRRALAGRKREAGEQAKLQDNQAERPGHGLRWNT